MSDTTMLLVARRGEVAKRMPVPVDTPWSAWNEAIGMYAKLVEQSQAAHDALSEALATRDRLEAEDLQGRADAIRQGKAAPAGDKLAKARAAEDAAKRHADACVLAVEQAAAELLDLLEQNRSEWADVLAGQIIAAREAEAKALDAHVAARAARSRLQALVSFAERFPAARFKPTAADGRVAVQGRNGDPIPFADVEAALRASLEPPTNRPANALPVAHTVAA
jgi:hypothetical protein